MDATPVLVGDAPPRASRPARGRTAPRLPTTLLVVSAVVLVTNLVMLFLGGWRTGVSVDEPIHVERLQHYLATGWYLPEIQMLGSSPNPLVADLYVYAPVASLFAHAVSVLLGTETWNEVSTAPDAYATRHLAVGLLSLIAVVAVAATARVLLRSWRWGVLAAAALTAIPTWLGHGMFNIKDAPVAAGYTTFTLGLVLASRPGFGRQASTVVASVGAAVLGTVLGVGTRPGILPAFGVSVAVLLGVTWWVESRSWDRRGAVLALRTRALAAVVAGVVGFSLLLLLYPALFRSPMLLIDAVTASSEYPWNGEILTAGSRMSMPPPPQYLPLWFAAQTPLVIQALALVGVAGGMRMLRPSRRDRSDRSLGAGIALLLAQIALLPLVAVLTRAVVYDGTRQMLFVLPALAVLATAGAWILARRFSGDGRSWRRGLLTAAVVLGLVVPTVTQIGLFPYNYTWFNAAAALKPIDGNWMTDYWGTSGREVIPLLPAEDPHNCGPWLPRGHLVPCAYSPQIGVYWPTRGSGVDAAPLAPGEYFGITFNRGMYQPEPQCTLVEKVSRPLFWREVTMSLTSRCRVPLERYPSGGIRTGGGAGFGYLLWGWYPPQATGVWSDDDFAEVGMTLPPALQDRDLRLSLDVMREVPPGEERTLQVVVNGVPVGAQVIFTSDDAGPRTVRVTVPRAVVEALADHRLIVRLEAPDLAAAEATPTRPRGVRLRSLDLDPVASPSATS